MRYAVELTSVALRRSPAPLLEEERDTGAFTGLAKFAEPLDADGPTARSALPASDQPVDPLEVDRTLLTL